MTREEKDIELIKQAINTKVYDGIEYFHTYKGVKYYRYFITTAQGGHTGWVKLAFVAKGKVSFVVDFSNLETILLDKLNNS